jgi:hypothetical protein
MMLIYLSYFFVLIVIISLMFQNKHGFYFAISANLFFIIKVILSNDKLGICLFSACFLVLCICHLIECDKKQ